MLNKLRYALSIGTMFRNLRYHVSKIGYRWYNYEDMLQRKRKRAEDIAHWTAKREEALALIPAEHRMFVFDYSIKPTLILEDVERFIQLVSPLDFEHASCFVAEACRRKPELVSLKPVCGWVMANSSSAKLWTFEGSRGIPRFE